ncbi:hypothetical protein ALC57_10824 [Trachymyrmex cornetzi]|uniref:Uncharacterized protein n=1 Tax=Trachymyrmex cornetzi TaxID=471704 RepID=A0A151J3C6_9HYME|nr:hypothetical protein ALC57_10824 [Trachymyrmex cornetzi]
MDDCKGTISDNITLDVLKTLLRHGCIYVSRIRKVYSIVSISVDLIITSFRHSRISVSLPPTCLFTNDVRYFITET